MFISRDGFGSVCILFNQNIEMSDSVPFSCILDIVFVRLTLVGFRKFDEDKIVDQSVVYSSGRYKTNITSHGKHCISFYESIQDASWCAAYIRDKIEREMNLDDDFVLVVKKDGVTIYHEHSIHGYHDMDDSDFSTRLHGKEPLSLEEFKKLQVFAVSFKKLELQWEKTHASGILNNEGRDIYTYKKFPVIDYYRYFIYRHGDNVITDCMFNLWLTEEETAEFRRLASLCILQRNDPVEPRLHLCNVMFIHSKTLQADVVTTCDKSLWDLSRGPNKLFFCPKEKEDGFCQDLVRLFTLEDKKSFNFAEFYSKNQRLDIIFNPAQKVCAIFMYS